MACNFRLAPKRDVNMEVRVQIGATRGSQLEEILRAIEAGPLEESIANRIEKIWELVQAEGPMDDYDM